MKTSTLYTTIPVQTDHHQDSKRKESAMLLRTPRTSPSATSHLTKRLLSVALCLLITMASVTSADAGILDLILSRTTQARDRAEAARDSANEIRGKVRDGVKHLSDKVRAVIEEQIQNLKDQIERRLEGRDQWVSEQCETYRAELIGFLEGLNSVAQTVQGLVTCRDTDPVIDLEQEIALIEQIPCELLYPLANLNLDSCVADRLRDGVEALGILQGLMDQAEAAADEEPEVEEDAPSTVANVKTAVARVWQAQYKVAVEAHKVVGQLGVILTFYGKLFNTIGETDFEASIGIHGYPSITVGTGQAKKLGGTLTTYGKAVSDFAGKIKVEISDSEELSIQDKILRNQEAILRNQELILGGGN